MKTPLVSVIVPNYNYSRYLKERLDSILNQSFEDFELIVLDDCSTDDSREVIERYSEHPKVRAIVYNSTNTGNPFVQWEKGLEMARGKYVWIAEADDYAEPEFLARTVKVMEGDEDIAVVKAMSKLIDGAGNPSPRKAFEDYPPDGKTYIYDGNDYIRHNMLKWNHCYNASMVLFRRDVWQGFKDKPYMRLRYVGDWMFWGMIMSGRKIGEVHEHLSRFRLHGNSVTDNAKRTRRVRAEGEMVAYKFRSMLPDLPFGLKVYNRYKLYKLFHKANYQSLGEELLAIDPDFWRHVGITPATYPAFWLYKHTIWLVERRIVSTKLGSLTPIEVIE